MMSFMKVVTAKVVDGKIDLPPEIADGSQVTVLAPDDAQPAVLSREEEQELSDALAEIHAGRFVDGWVLLDEIKAQSRA